MHCMTVSLAYNGKGLGTVWGRQKAEEMLKEAGFSEKIEVREVPGDIFNFYYIVQKVRSVNKYNKNIKRKLGPRRFGRKTFRVETQSSARCQKNFFCLQDRPISRIR